MDPPNTNQTKYIHCVQTIFAKQHFQQLRLDFSTNIFDPYSKIFLDVNVFEIENKNEVLEFLKQQRPDVFLHVMNKLVSSNKFAGQTPLQSILELILTTNQKDNETSYTTSRRIQSASLLFENIVDNFPPSWSFCSNVYKHLFYAVPINMKVDYKELRMNPTDGFFPVILALLEDAFKDDDNSDSNTSGFDSMMNFQQYERIENSRCCYSKLTRKDKIDRLFVVLNLLVKMMEIDLTIWIHRYPFQTRKFMSSTNTCPLIAHLLWRGNDCGEINVIIRHILKLFNMSVWIDFPSDKTDILARLVNLISVAINLSENCDSANLITYPNFKRLTEAFVAEVGKSVESFPYTMAFYIKVVSKIKSPLIRMLVSVRIFNKFSKEFENVSLRKIFDNISNENYKQYSEKMDDVESERHSSENYPTYDPKKATKTPKHLTFTRDEYLTLVLHLFVSYIEVYRTNDLEKALLSDDNNPSSQSVNDQSYRRVHQKVENEKNHRLDFPKLMKDAKRLKIVAKDLATTDMLPVVPLLECQNVFLDPTELVRYQEDLEYLVKLKETVDQNVQFGDTFKKWRAAIKQL